MVVFLLGTTFLFLHGAQSIADHGEEDGIEFLILGDWGREGTANQTGVARLMGHVSRTRRPLFIVSTGDNFYPNGLNSTRDALFDASFKNVYTDRSLQLPWYAVLGNHDYGDGIEGYCENDSSDDCDRSPRHQLGVGLADRDDRWFCQRRYTKSFGNGLLDVFFIDTSPMILSYHDTEWARYPGGIHEQNWESQLKELESDLESSKAPWKIVVGHHPPRSNGEHGNNTDLIENLEPILQRQGVHALFSGHDHSLEHMKFDDIRTQYFVTGAGSDCDRGFIGDAGSMYQYISSGFVAVRVARNEMVVDYYTLEGGQKPQYRAVLSP